MVFPVVTYECESLTIKKAEHRRIDAFEVWCWRRLLRVPWTAKEIQPDTLDGRQILHVNAKMISGPGLTMTNQLPNQKLPLSAEPKPKIHPCAPALWPSPVRNSWANMSNAITPLRSSWKHLQETASNQRIPAQAIQISSSNILIYTAGVTNLRVESPRKSPNLCWKA